MMDASIHVVVCDKSSLIRSGLKAILRTEDDIELTTDVSDWRSIEITSCQESHPNVILLGTSSECEFTSALTELRATISCAGVIAVHNSPSTNEQCLSEYLAGASGIIEQENTPGYVLDVIRNVAAGGVVIAPPVAKLLLELIPNMPLRNLWQSSLLEILSVREQQIFAHIVNGHSNREIAQKLSITEGTVRTHISNLLRKLNLRSRVEAVLFANRYGAGEYVVQEIRQRNPRIADPRNVTRLESAHSRLVS